MIKKNSYTKSQIKNHRLRKQIYEQVMTNIVTQLNEGEMNELFGWGNGVSKPEQALTAEYVSNASQEELAETIASWLNYWADSAKDGLDKALSSAITPCLQVCQAGEDKAKKFLDSLRGSVAKGLQNGLESTKNGAKALPRLIIMGVALCVKLAANGVEKAKQYAQSLYQGVIKFTKNLYTTCSEAIEKGWDTVKEKAELLGKLACAIFTLVAHKVTGAKEMCAAWIKEIIDAAKQETIMAVLIVRSWFATIYDVAKEALQ